MTKKTFVTLEDHCLRCQSEWDIEHFTQIQKALKKLKWPREGTIILDGQKITKLDSAGVWLLSEWQEHLTKKGLKVNLEHFAPENATLIKIVKEKEKDLQKLPKIKEDNSFAKIGKSTIATLQGIKAFLNFTGYLFSECMRTFTKPSRWRFSALTSTIQRTGLEALPIIALLSFMIGIVISYQMGNQLRAYGANVFIVDLLGLSILREFGPLITAIMVAGRTGSAFTAQLGTMKINQEMDALNTMGVTPAELLLLPRLIGLIIALPLLTVWADIFGVLGGMIMANNMLDISWYDFLQRFQQEIPVRSLIIGIGKAPVFAFLIGSIGCFQGMQVRGSAESVGLLTTRSVVLGIFFIIVSDAIFSVIFSKLQL